MLLYIVLKVVLGHQHFAPLGLRLQGGQVVNWLPTFITIPSDSRGVGRVSMRQLDVTRFLSTVPFIDLVMALYGIQVWRGRFAGIGKKRLEDLNDVGQVTWRLLAGVPCLALGVCLLTPAMLMSHYNETSGNSAVKFTSVSYTHLRAH